MPPDVANSVLHFNLLDEPLIRWRSQSQGKLHCGSLPELFAAMAANTVRDFPALRPHQRHPWHALLTQVAVIALHRAGQAEPWGRASEWRTALLALTPDDADGAAWCLVSSPLRPALLQSPVPDGNVDSWMKQLHAADELDMLVTSKNHDLKSARARRAEPDDWLFALVSLQTQEGFLGAGNYGISRMNGGFASRPGVGVAVSGNWGERWVNDVCSLLAKRDAIADTNGFAVEEGHALLWLLPWTGNDSMAFKSLDPFYIEVCRRVRLEQVGSALFARVTGSKAARVASKDRNGVTGDAWTPVDTAEGKALTVAASGFDYRLMTELLVGGKYTTSAAYRLDGWPDGVTLQLLAQATVRGQGKTEGFHERRVPISPRLRRLLLGPQRTTVEKIAEQRIKDIATVRDLLRSALVMLFANGESGDSNASIKNKASRFGKPFEQREDARFFEDMSQEIEAEEAEHANQRLNWMKGLVLRAEAVLREAFDAGPRNSMQRYKARAAALSRFHGGLRGTKPALPDLAHHYQQEAAARAVEEELSHV
jgi:CRISPR system Cascade subunit CasA